MLRLRSSIVLALFCGAAGAADAAARVRDVNTQRNQVTVVMSKAGEIGMGAKVYFYRSGKSTGSAQITQAFHTKAMARILSGNPQTGDDATTTAKPPKAAAKISRVAFGAASVQAHEFLVELQFDKQEKLQRKLTLNAEVAAQIQGAPGYIGISASLLKQLDIVWENGSLRVVRAQLSDRSAFDLAAIVATDLYSKIKPAAETRNQTVTGKIVFLKKVRDLQQLADGIRLDLSVSAKSERIRAGTAYKLKVYCNELFATEFLLRPDGRDITDSLTINPADLSPAENNLEFRLVEVTEQGDLQLETDNNQLVAMLGVESTLRDKNPRVKITLAAGQDAFAGLAKQQ